MNIDAKLKGHFLNLYHIAISDSEVDTTELEMLYRIGEERGISKSDIDQVVVRPDLIKFSTPETVIEKIEYLYDLARISWADGKVDENERRVMSMFCSRFGFEDENVGPIVDFLLDEVRNDTSRADILKKVSENL